MKIVFSAHRGKPEQRLTSPSFFFYFDKVNLPDPFLIIADKIPHVAAVLPDTGCRRPFRPAGPAVEADLAPVVPVLLQLRQEGFLLRGSHSFFSSHPRTFFPAVQKRDAAYIDYGYFSRPLFSAQP